MTAESLKLRCLRCNHSWLRRTDDAPKCCPNCKSRLWAQERQPREEGKAK